MSRTSSLIVLCVMVLCQACGDVPGSGAQSGDPPLSDRLPANFLPKADLKPDRRLGKADLIDDFKLFYKEKYKVTAAPTSTGFRAPGEFEPQKYLLVGWVDGVLDLFFTGIVKGAWGTTTVVLIDHRDSGTFNYDVRAQMKKKLIAAGLPEVEVNDPAKLLFIQALNDSVWARDYGPQALIHQSGKLSFVDARYYHSRPFDDKIPTELGESLGISIFRPSLRFEGGNFQSNGKGDCFTTRGIIHKNLPDPDAAGTVARLKQYFGCQNVVLLQGLEGEGTSHIDMFMMVIGERDIVVGEYGVNDDCINRDLLKKNVEILSQITENGQQKYRIWRIPMPPNSDGVWRTYTNLQIVRGVADPSKGVVLLPVYANFDSYQATALATLQQAFAAAYGGTDAVSWTFVKINSDAIIPANGSIHCVVHEIPAALFAKEESSPAGLCESSETPHNCQKGGCIGDLVTIDAAGLCDGNNRVRCVEGVVRVEACASPCYMRSDPSLACEKSCGVVNGQAVCGDAYLCADSTCTNQCYQGETGCNADGSQRYTCSLGQDGCLQRTYSACQQDASCINGACVATNNCGDVDYIGKCEGNTVVWCEDNELYSLNCSVSNALCGFSAEFAYTMCLNGSSCTDECQPGEKGCDGNLAWACQKSASSDCYIKNKSSCADSTCRNGVCCLDECQLDAVGCNLDKTQRWSCLADENGCLIQQQTACGNNSSCDAGVCKAGCSDDCKSGESGCSDDQKTVWECKIGTLGCLVKSKKTACGTNERCESGACVKSCNNSCEANTKGCEEGKQASWVCVSDGDGCRSKQVTVCPPGQECRNGQCHGGATCDNECELGTQGCHDSGISAWICQTPKDSLCTLKVTVPCLQNQVCQAGLCVAAPKPDVTLSEPDAGSPGDTSAPQPGSSSSCQQADAPRGGGGWLMLLLIVGLRLRRRASGSGPTKAQRRPS